MTKSLIINPKSLFKKLYFWRGYSRRNKTATAVFATVLILVGGFYAWNVIHPSGSEAAWFDTSWLYRQTVSVTNNGSTQSSYQITVAMDTQSLIAAKKMKSDCSDVRFADSTGTTLLSYFTDYCSNTASVNSVFFVQVPSISAGASSFYVYYGNSKAASISSYIGMPTGLNPGTGKDGSIAITADTNINTANSISGRSCSDTTGGDAVIYTSKQNTATSSASIVVDSTPTSGCLATGDEVMIMNMQGNSSYNGNVGQYEFARVTSLSGTTISLNHALVNGYNGLVQKIIVQRVPNYTSVTTSNAGTDFTPSAWDGTKGGVMAFRANGTVTVAASTTINANALGYRGGTGGAGATTGTGGLSGESFDGQVGQGGDVNIAAFSGGGKWTAAGIVSPADGAIRGGGGGGGSGGTPSGGGGGAGGGYGFGGAGGGGGAPGTGGNGGAANSTSNVGGGGGGGRATSGNGGVGGSAGSDGAPGSGSPGLKGSGITGASGAGGTNGFTNGGGGGGGGGAVYGDATIASNIYFGSAGGGGGGADGGSTNGTTGGNGGGIVFISAATLSVSGNIQSNGTASTLAASNAGSGGAGAGGSILIRAASNTIGTNLISSTGGARSFGTTVIAGGGAGGDGRIRTDYSTNSGSTNSPTSSTSTIPSASNPTNEEVSPQPIAYWALDDGVGTTAKDSSKLKNDATLVNLDSQPSTRSGWMTEENCVSGKCVKLPGGTSGSITVSNTVSNVQTVSFWVRPASTSAALIDLNATDVSITASSGTVTATNFTSPTVYVNGSTKITTIPANQWSFITVTTGTAVTASAIKIGNVKGNYLNGFIDEVKFYNYARSAAQVQADYNSRASSNGGGNVLGASVYSTLSNALMGYWKMDESSWAGTTGEVGDSSGNGTNGTASGNATTAVGKFGNGGTFDGTNDHVSMGNPSALQITGAVTISTWVKFNSLSTDQFIAGRASPGVGGSYWLGYLHSTDAIGFSIVNGVTEYDAGVVGAVTTGTWYHLVGVYVPSKYMRFYINGVLVYENTSVPGSLNNQQNFTVGETDNGLADLNGSVDELRVYNRAFSPSEVSQLYNFAPGPITYWDFEDGRGSTITDKSGNNVTGTWAGTGAHWKSGKYGRGGAFSSSASDSVSGTLTNSLSNESMTVEGWVYRNSSGTGDGWFKAGSSNSTGKRILISIGSSGSIKFTFWGSDSFTAAGIVAMDSWHHVAATYDAVTGQRYVYYDGKLVGTSSTATPYTGDNSIVIGNAAPASCCDSFDGLSDEMKIYNYVRTPRQIVSDMNAAHPNVGSPVSSSVAYYDMDEGYGTTINNLGAGGINLRGTMTNMASPPSAVSGWTQDGKYGKAIEYDGNNDYIDISGNPTSLQFTTDMTVSAWVNLTTNNAVHDIVAKKGSSGQFGYRLSTTATGNLQFELSSTGSNTRAATGSSTLIPGRWYHVVGTYTPSNSITVYVNGQQDGQVTTALPNSIFNSSADVNIGGENSGASNLMKGAIDEVRIYGDSLTSDEVKLDMNAGKTLVLGAMSDTSGLTGGMTASNSASAEYCIPGDTSTCSAPVARYDFEEGSGTTANDISGNGNTGTWNGTLGSQWTQGKVGKASNFDGSTNYIDAPYSSTLDLGNHMTISLWAKRNGGLGAYRGLLVRRSPTAGATNTSYSLYYGSSNNIEFWIYSGGFKSVVSNAAITDSNWHQITVSWNGTTANIYLDGKLDKSGSFSFTPGATGDETLRIGNDQWTPSREFPGKIDQVRVYSYARSAAQVAWEYNRGAPISNFDLDECSGSTVHDIFSNSNNGTVTLGSGGTTTVGTCTTASSFWGGTGGTGQGKYNYAPTFDGTDDYIDLGSSTALTFSSSWTLSAWVNPTAAPQNSGVIAESWTGFGDKVQFELGFDFDAVNANSRASVGFFDGTTWYMARDTSNISTSTWSLITGTWDGTTLKIYKNGLLVGSSTPGVSDTSDDDTIYIGRRHDTSGTKPYFPGLIDDARIYNYALTPSQIMNVYNQNSSVRYGPSTGTP